MTASPVEAVVVARGLTKHFGGVTAVDAVDWTLEVGSIGGIVGPNGSGKTTFVNCLSGFLRSDSGSVTLSGEDITRLAMRDRAGRGLSRTFQQSAVFNSLTVSENLGVASRRARPGGYTIDGVLEMFGLQERRSEVAESLPYGLRRMLGAAMAIILNPIAVLLDEPTSGLNEAESHELRTTLERCRRDGISMGIIDHHMDFLLPLCDHMTLLQSGRRVWHGTPKEFADDELVRSVYLGKSKT